MRVLPSRVAMVLVAASLLGCNEGERSVRPAAVRDSAGIRIVEHVGDAPARWALSATPFFRIPEHVPPDELALDPVSVQAGPDGTVIVGDGNQVGRDGLLIYGADGSLRSFLGGSGRGPGEFGGQLWWADRYHADSIVAWDRRGPMGPSIKVFGFDGAYSRDVTIPQPERPRPQGSGGFSSGAHGWFTDGDFLTSSSGYTPTDMPEGGVRFRHLLLSVDPEGLAWDTIGEFGLVETYWDGQQQQGYRFGAPGLVKPIGDQVLLANSRDCELRVLDRSGQPTMVVRRIVPAVPVGPQHVEESVETFMDFISRQPGIAEADLGRMRETIEATPTAPTLPAYSNVLVDEELRVWVERYRWPDPWSLPLRPRPTVWDVFARDGSWLATLDVPARLLLLSVSQGRVYGVRVDEWDVKHVEAYEVIDLS